MTRMPPELAALGDSLHRLLRTIQRRKAQLVAEGEESEWAAHVLLEQIATTGPMRAAQLAECTSTDPSTVSRHVAALVRTQLVERRADPVDGRASLLVATELGVRTVNEHRAKRAEWLVGLLESWSPRDRAEFGRLVDKFTLTLEADLPSAGPTAPAPEGHR